MTPREYLTKLGMTVQSVSCRPWASVSFSGSRTALVVSRETMKWTIESHEFPKLDGGLVADCTIEGVTPTTVTISLLILKDD